MSLFDGYEDKLTARKKERKQSTRSNQLAVETAQLLGDTKIGFYTRIFKQHEQLIPELLACRDWVLSKGADRPGAMFASQYKKFIHPAKKQ
jgi:hypothetical protein